MLSSVKLVPLLHCALLIASEGPTGMNLGLLADIINSTSQFHQFDVVPILAAEQTLFEIQDFIISLQKPTYILSNVHPNAIFHFNDFEETLIISFLRGAADVILEMTDTFTSGKRIACTLFVLTRPTVNHREIDRIMIHAWRNNYMRALLLYQDNQGRDYLVTYDIYDYFAMKNVIDSYKETDIYVLRLYGNMRHFRIKSPMKIDMPRVFEVTAPKGGKKFTGYSYQLFMAYVQYMNATFEEYHMRVHQDVTNVVMNDIKQLLLDGTIEISLHPYDRTSSPGLQTSYPIGFNDICVIVPVAHEIPSYMYLKRPLQPSVWLLVLAGTIGLLLAFMWIPVNSRDGRQEFGQALLASMGHMLNFPTSQIRYHVTWRYKLVYNAGWILGFLLTTWYRALLQSYWATTIFGPQIDTIHDFLNSGMKIPVKDEDLEGLRRQNQLPSEFVKRCFLIDVDSLAKARTEFNTSYAYMVSTDRWWFLSLQQQYSERPLFRLSNICVMKSFISYPMTHDSRLQYSLQAFILYIQQSGLLNHWMISDFREAAKEGYVKLMMDSHHLAPLRYENLLLAFWVFEIGLAICFVVFLAEVLMHLQQKFRRRILAHLGRIAQRVGQKLR